MHLQQVEEVKAQSQEIRCLSALVKQQQEAIEKLTSPHSPPREPVATSSCLQSQIEAMREEAFNVVLRTVNTMQGAVVLQNTTITSSSIVNRTSFEDIG